LIRRLLHAVFKAHVWFTFEKIPVLVISMHLASLQPDICIDSLHVINIIPDSIS